MNLDEKKAHLEEIGCCRRCCLRFLGKQDVESFSSLDDKTDEDNVGERPSKILKTSPCITCIGLLEDSLIDSAIKMASAAVNANNHDSKDCSLALSLPVSFQLRNHAMLLHLMEKFPLDGSHVKPDARFISIKEVFKMIAGPKLGKAVNKTVDSMGNSPLSIGFNFSYEYDEDDSAPLAKMDPSTFLPHKSSYHKSKISRKSVDPNQYPKELFQKFFTCPPVLPKQNVICSSISLSHSSLYVAGRYRKLQRGLSQTPWLINGTKQTETCVQELLCDRMVTLTRADDMRFSSSGREDVDVRMLGRGRPFVCELINPRHVSISVEEFRALEKQFVSENCAVEALYLQIVSRDAINELKKGEEEKKKVYSAYCIVNKGTPDWAALKRICELCPIVIQQRTPIRVLHRRSLATRPRSIEWMEVRKAETSEPRAFIARFRTQAGTYVKEFIHGDLGRTTPNLCQLLGDDVDILALDVEDVEIDWPPEVK